jgi:hypothetical protein
MPLGAKDLRRNRMFAGGTGQPPSCETIGTNLAIYPICIQGLHSEPKKKKVLERSTNT